MMFDRLEQPASVFASDGTVLYVNPAGARLFGRDAADLVGRTYLELWPDLAGHPCHAAFERVARDPDGSERLEHHHAPTDTWSSQKLYRAGDHGVVLREDISARKREASESERQFRTMVEWMPQLAWLAGPDGGITYYNPGWYAYTGTVPEDMAGWGWKSVHHPDHLDAVVARWTHSVRTGEPFEMEFPLRRHDGVFRWFLTRVSPLRDDAGRIVRWIGINTDIDDQRTSLDLIEETLESMGDAFFMLDREWRIVKVNRHQEAVSKTPRAQVLGRVFWDVFPTTRELAYWSEYHLAMEQRVERNFTEYYAALDLWTEVDVYPARNSGISVFFRDVSERKRSEREMASLLAREKEARATAESAVRAKDDFLAMLGHELRNPLAPIQTAVQLMQLRAVPGIERERVVIERQVKHLVRLVDDLLDVSRMTRGKVALSREPVDLVDVLSQSIEMAGPLLEQGRHGLVTEVERGLVVDADPGRLAQVFANLLSNAAKYTSPGGRVTVRAAREAGEVVVAVTDTGVGLSPELISTVFDLFVQARQTLDRAQGGLGLGLTIVRTLVGLHGGSVSAHSGGPGQGSTFTVRLPLLVGATVQPVAGARAAETSACSGRLLIVDDNVDAAELLAECLRAMGYTTLTAYDAPSALEALDRFTPEVALLDIGLPVMDGYELARQLRLRPELSGLGLVAITGYGQDADRALAREAGFDQHFVKPVNMTELTLSLARMRGAEAAKYGDRPGFETEEAS